MEEKPDNRVCGNPGCNVTPPLHHNFCGWECSIEAAKKDGAIEHLPNDLPIKCINANGLLTECEHGDHLDYIFPVVVNYVGKPKERTWIDGDGNKKPMTPAEVDDFANQTHALIYTDGSIAVTMYECCYAMWYLKSGELAGGSLWEKGEWKLSEESRIAAGKWRTGSDYDPVNDENKLFSTWQWAREMKRSIDDYVTSFAGKNDFHKVKRTFDTWSHSFRQFMSW